MLDAGLLRESSFWEFVAFFHHCHCCISGDVPFCSMLCWLRCPSLQQHTLAFIPTHSCSHCTQCIMSFFSPVTTGTDFTLMYPPNARADTLHQIHRLVFLQKQKCLGKETTILRYLQQIFVCLKILKPSAKKRRQVLPFWQ